MNVEANVGGERSPYKDRGRNRKGKKTCTVYPTTSPSIKKTTNKPGDPRIEEDDTWNSHRDANSGGRPVPSTFSVRRIAGVLLMVVGIYGVYRFYRWRPGFLLVVC